MSKFKAGDKVVPVSEVKFGHSTTTMEVEGIAPDGRIIVKYEHDIDDAYYKHRSYHQSEDSLMLLSESKEKLDLLSQEYDKLAPPVRKKIAAFKKSFDDLNVLIEGAGLQFSDFGGAKEFVRDMIDAGGWTYSSFSC